MSSASIIVAIIVLIGVLVSYAFIQQTVQSKREQRARLIAALKSRLRTFKFMLGGFPENFLPKDIKILVQRSLADVCEQLSKLEPRVSMYVQELEDVTAQLAETQRQPETKQHVTLDNPQQFKDVRAGLEELYKFIYRLEARKVIPVKHGEHYRREVKDLALQVSVDSHILNGRNAMQSGKTKLAIHYFDLAEKLITRESRSEAFGKKLRFIMDTLTELKSRLSEEEAAALEQSSSQSSDPGGVGSEWDKFSEAESNWKKKNVYD